MICVCDNQQLHSLICCFECLALLCRVRSHSGVYGLVKNYHSLSTGYIKICSTADAMSEG